MRCPFSAGAGDPSLKYDDNGWIFGTRAKALATAALVCPEPALPAGKVKIMFWGIVDLKYDHHKPLLERIRVLETGDGRISRFSGDGAPIQKHFEDHYQLQEQEAALQFASQESIILASLAISLQSWAYAKKMMSWWF